MAHDLSFTRNSTGDMAYVGETPWHGFGQRLNPGAPLETWIEAGGFDWEVISRPAYFPVPDADGFDKLIPFPGKQALLRSDNFAPLSIVGGKYQIVQPKEVMGFFRELIEVAGFEMHTAGVLRGGAVYWALAKVNTANIKLADDIVEPYILVATSADGSMSTIVHPTAVRVVCQNTLTFAAGVGGKRAYVQVPHAAKVNFDDIKSRLGLIPTAWLEFADTMENMATLAVSRDEAVRYFVDILSPKKADEKDDAVNIVDIKGNVERLLDVYENGVGQNLVTAKGTVWGLVNAATRFVDHERVTRGDNGRLNSAWFGSGANLKSRAWERAKALI